MEPHEEVEIVPERLPDVEQIHALTGYEATLRDCAITISVKKGHGCYRFTERGRAKLNGTPLPDCCAVGDLCYLDASNNCVFIHTAMKVKEWIFCVESEVQEAAPQKRWPWFVGLRGQFHFRFDQPDPSKEGIPWKQWLFDWVAKNVFPLAYPQQWQQLNRGEKNRYGVDLEARPLSVYEF
jgi:hypothetical protein